MTPSGAVAERLLIVDDEPENIRFLERTVRDCGYHRVRSTRDPFAALDMVAEAQPDLILLDLHMPALDGFGVLARLRPLVGGDTYLPVLMLTGDASAETRKAALANGVKDFLTKPFDADEVRLRIGNLLETRQFYLRLREQNATLEVRVRDRTREVEDTRTEVTERLALAAEFRDDDTGQHTLRVGEMSARVAEALGLPAAEVARLWRAAPLHDIGKIGIPDAVLLKPGRLTPDEFDVMKRHTTIGGQILAGSHAPVLQLAEQVAQTHHENWDGSGYPAGLAGDAIPLVGRIVAVADVFDALTHERPYKPAWPHEKAIDEIDSLAGRKFDPAVVSAFQTVVQGKLQCS